MSTPSPSSPPKRPRLSLQIKAIADGSSVRTSRRVAAAVDVKSPTAFNTLSNVYATAVDRSTPVQENPPTAIFGRRPMLRLQTQDAAPKDRRAHTPYLGPLLDTPVTAQPMSPAVAKQIFFPSSAMTATPPLSAQPPEQNNAQVFTFDTASTMAAAGQGAPAPAPTPQNPKRRATMPAWANQLPYTHPRSLRSILRNSPLPPLNTKSPESPRRQSLRLQEKAARRVAYNSPLTQTITTSWYTKSHIDLLAEDATPISPCMSSSDDGDNLLDQAMADAGNNTRDGGQTPGPFEEMRRRMANMQASTPVALSPTGGGGGIRKRGGKRREKKRRWVWTIGQEEDADEGDDAVTPATAIMTAATVSNAERKSPAAAAPSVPVIALPSPRPRTRNQSLLAKVASATAAPMLSMPVPPVRAPAARPPSRPAQAPALVLIAPRPQSQPQSQPLYQPRPQIQNQYARELTPIPPNLRPSPSLSPSPRPSPEPSSFSHNHSLLRHVTPEPLSLVLGSSGGGVIEPPTPSVESTTSVGSSVFERDGDAEMSDASSFGCMSDDCDGEEQHRDMKTGYEGGWFNGAGGRGGVGGGNDGDVDMDEGTPTMTARPVSTGELERGWAPWREPRQGFVGVEGGGEVL